MVRAQSMRLTEIVERQLFTEKRRLPVSHTPGAEHSHWLTPFVAVRLTALQAQNPHQETAAISSLIFQRVARNKAAGSGHFVGQPCGITATNDIFCLF